MAERVPFGTSRFHCDSRRRIQLEQGNGGFCLQTHRLNATKLLIRCVRVALKSSFIDRFERCVFVFFAVYRKANCVVLVLFWLASIDLRNKGMPNRRCPCIGARDTAHLFGECSQTDTTSRVLRVIATKFYRNSIEFTVISLRVVNNNFKISTSWFLLNRDNDYE
jgi:hypothetical protein